jgi:hypothetical protein
MEERLGVVQPETVIRWHREGFRRDSRSISVPGTSRRSRKASRPASSSCSSAPTAASACRDICLGSPGPPETFGRWLEHPPFRWLPGSDALRDGEAGLS